MTNISFTIKNSLEYIKQLLHPTPARESEHHAHFCNSINLETFFPLVSGQNPDFYDEHLASMEARMDHKVQAAGRSDFLNANESQF